MRDPERPQRLVERLRHAAHACVAHLPGELDARPEPVSECHVPPELTPVANLRPRGREARAPRRARGTPRVANRLLKRVRDFAQVRAGGVITRAVADEALSLLDVDPLGLDDIDRRVIRTVIDKFDGGPVGLETIAAALSEEPDTIMDVVEPYLLQLGFLDRTPRGRVATRRAYEHLGIPYEPQAQPGLF